jgi:hypothetical protein
VFRFAPRDNDLILEKGTSVGDAASTGTVPSEKRSFFGDALTPCVMCCLSISLDLQKLSPETSSPTIEHTDEFSERRNTLSATHKDDIERQKTVPLNVTIYRPCGIFSTPDIRQNDTRP